MRKSLSGSVLVIGQPLLVNVIGVPVAILIIRALGPLGYGQWNTAMALVGVFIVMTGSGLRPVFVRAVAQSPEQAGEAVGDQLVLRTVLTIGASCCAVIACALLRYPPIILACVLVSALGMLLSVYGNVVCDLLQAYQKFKAYAGVNFAAGIAVTFAALVAIWIGVGPVGLTVAYLSQPLSCLLLTLVIMKRDGLAIRIRPNWARYRQTLRVGRPLGLNQALMAMRERTVHVLVPKVVGIANYGYFAAGTLPITRLDAVPDGFMTTFYPAVARAWHEDNATAGRAVLDLIVTSLVVCVPLAILISFLSLPLAAVLFPHRHARLVSAVIRVSIWALPLRSLQASMSSSVNATGKHLEAARAGVIATVCSVAVTAILVVRFGLVGAAWSVVTKSALSSGFVAPPFIRTFPDVLRRVPLARIGAGTAIMAACLTLRVLLPGSGAAGACLVGCLALALYLVALHGLGVVDLGVAAHWLRSRVLRRAVSAP